MACFGCSGLGRLVGGWWFWCVGLVILILVGSGFWVFLWDLVRCGVGIIYILVPFVCRFWGGLLSFGFCCGRGLLLYVGFGGFGVWWWFVVLGFRVGGFVVVLRWWVCGTCWGLLYFGVSGFLSLLWAGLVQLPLLCLGFRDLG